MNERILITGFSGFVGQHFLEYLFNINFKGSVMGIDIKAPQFNTQRYSLKILIDFRIVNLMCFKELENVLLEFKPQYILHLASFSSVAYSWERPIESFQNNTNIFLNLLMAVKQNNLACRILSVGSSEEYGNVSEDLLPLKEHDVLNPISPYAVARVSQEMLAKVFVDNYGLDIVLTRSFNHLGPWQDERFAIPSFIKRIKKIKEDGQKKGIIEGGDISIVRDFVDVRDVVRAYYILLKKGRKGEVYNVCSGKGVMLEEVIKIISRILEIEIDVKCSEKYVRPNDNKVVVGTFYKMYHEFGWQPQITLEQTIADMIG